MVAIGLITSMVAMIKRNLEVKLPATWADKEVYPRFILRLGLLYGNETRKMMENGRYMLKKVECDENRDGDDGGDDGDGGGHLDGGKHHECNSW